MVTGSSGGFLLYPGSPNDSTLFDKIVNELIRRRVMRKGDMLVLDKEFYAYYPLNRF